MVGETIMMFKEKGNFFLKIVVAVVNGFRTPRSLWELSRFCFSRVKIRGSILNPLVFNKKKDEL